MIDIPITFWPGKARLTPARPARFTTGVRNLLCAVAEGEAVDLDSLVDIRAIGYRGLWCHEEIKKSARALGYQIVKRRFPPQKGNHLLRLSLKRRESGLYFTVIS